MAVYTDSPEYAGTVLPECSVREFAPVLETDSSTAPPLDEFFPGDGVVFKAPGEVGDWNHVLLSEFAPRSNYDQLIQLARASALPDRLACLAGAGHGFHGFKGRSWVAAPGNLHLSVHLAPNRPIDRFEVAFTILAAISVVDAVDTVAELRGEAGVKWVNDVVVDGAKIAGVLAYTQTGNDCVHSAVLGLGVNVNTAPAVEPTPFVPRVACMRDFLPHGGSDTRHGLLKSLLDALSRNYEVLLEDGYRPLLDRYRARCVVLGQDVTVCSEDSDEVPFVVAGGTVVAIGDGLELHMAGQSAPITGGRLILGAEAGKGGGGGAAGALSRPGQNRMVS